MNAEITIFGLAVIMAIGFMFIGIRLGKMKILIDLMQDRIKLMQREINEMQKKLNR